MLMRPGFHRRHGGGLLSRLWTQPFAGAAGGVGSGRRVGDSPLSPPELSKMPCRNSGERGRGGSAHPCPEGPAASLCLPTRRCKPWEQREKRRAPMPPQSHQSSLGLGSATMPCRGKPKALWHHQTSSERGFCLIKHENYSLCDLI